VFDLFFPQQYPGVAPLMHFDTNGQGRARMNPNLYADGKVRPCRLPFAIRGAVQTGSLCILTQGQCTAAQAIHDGGSLMQIAANHGRKPCVQSTNSPAACSLLQKLATCDLQAQVCLSLLGTWHGGAASEKWNPDTSGIFQILLSVQVGHAASCVTPPRRFVSTASGACCATRQLHHHAVISKKHPNLAAL